jgi:ParB/RepB/Spo0J family partition protein
MKTAKKERQEIKVTELTGHPLNRSFDREGPVWDDFLDSVREHGVVESLFVRPHVDGFQVLAGHRRLAAAVEAGMETVPCQVKDLDDREALVFLINSNLQRENPNLVEEARLVQALVVEMGMSALEVMRELSRDEEWVETRQMVFAFDTEVQVALETGELSEGAFREILRAPEPLREKATQLVLYGGGDSDEPMSAERARQFIQFSLVPEWEKQNEWEQAMEKTRKAVAKDLKKLCQSGGDLTVCVMPWGKGVDGLGTDLVHAKEVVPTEYLAEGVEPGKAWVAYAEKIGAPVYVIPPDKTHHDKRLLVSRRVLLDDAAARMEHGMASELLPKERMKKDAAVERAKAVINGEGEKDYDEEEPVAPVAATNGEDGIRIEQKMEHHAWVDVAAVKRLAMWACSNDADPTTAPEWVPGWAKELAYEGRWSTIDAVVNWVQGLKKKV